MGFAERLKLYEQQYYYSLSTRDSIESRMKNTIVALGLVFALLSFLFSDVVSTGNLTLSTLWMKVFWSFFAFSICSFFIAVVWLVVAWYGYEYQWLPKADSIEGHHSEIKANCEAALGDDEDESKALEWTSKQFNKFLLDQYVQISSHNTVNNVRKAICVHNSATFTILAFVLVSVACVLHFTISTQPPEPNLQNAFASVECVFHLTTFS